MEIRSKTEEEATKKAIEQLNVNRDDIENIKVEVIEEPNKGFLGFIGAKDGLYKITVTEKVEIIEEEGKYGYKLTTKKENLSEINEDASGSLDSNFDYDKYVNLTEEKGLFTNTYKVNLNLKDAMLGELSAEEKSMLAFVGGSANIGIHIKTPIELEESNATSVTEENDKYIYNWDYNLSNIGSINATMKAPNIINIGIVIVLVIAVVVGIVVVIRKKNKKENLDSDINKGDNTEE